MLICICDDFQADRLHIKKLINSYCVNESLDAEIISFDSGETLLKYYADKKPSFDIVFLDIYMGGKNGIQAARQIREYDSDCKIIFTTSSSEHALESFEVLPFNYLVKPILKPVFDSAFEKALRAIDKEKQKSLSFLTGSNIRTVYFKDVVYIGSNARLISIHTATGEDFSNKAKLDEIQKQINDRRFIRCHKSFLVNMDYVLSVEEYSFILLDGAKIPITQRYFAGNKKMFFDYVLEKANLKNA
jgi:Response regulator of the LytR/AlgR family